MDDDFNTPKALAVIFKMIRQINILLTRDKFSASNAKKTLNFLKNAEIVLGILFTQTNIIKIPSRISQLAEKEINQEKTADGLKLMFWREQIKKKGMSKRSEGRI